jgi:DNA-binding NtrC family response regulator
MREGSDSYSVLVVEDELNHQLLIRRELSADKHPFGLVRFAQSLDEARDCIGQRAFDCMLVDNRLPGGRGLDLIDSLIKKGSNTAFILMTSAGSEELVVQAYRSRVSAYVTKTPGFWQELPTIILRAIEETRANRADQTRLEKLEASLSFLDEKGIAKGASQTDGTPVELPVQVAALSALSREDKKLVEKALEGLGELGPILSTDK